MSKYHDLKADLAVARTGQAEQARVIAGLIDQIEQYRASRTCLLAGPNRGDCEHFIGWNQNTDEWGVPEGWCIVCYWHHEALDVGYLRGRVIELNAQIRQAQGLNQNLAERNAHQARLIDEARDERDGSNLLLGRILDQLDRDLGAERDGPLSDLRREGRLHVGWDTEH